MTAVPENRPAPPLSAARVCGELALWLVAVIVASSVLAPLSFAVIDRLAPGAFAFSRVFRRVASLVAVLLLWLLLRRWGIRAWVDLGWRRTGVAWRHFAISVAAGGTIAAALVSSELVLGNRAWQVGLTAPQAVLAAVAALVIGLVEETVFRGALFLGLASRLRGGLWAIALASSALYSTVHFARGGRGRVAGTWDGGLRLWAEIPDAMVYYGEAAIGLTILGLFSCAIAWHRQHLAEAAGFHAGAVFGLRCMTGLTAAAAPGQGFWLVDGLQPGWRLTLLMAAVALSLAFRRPHPD